MSCLLPTRNRELVFSAAVAVKVLGHSIVLVWGRVMAAYIISLRVQVKKAGVGGLQYIFQQTLVLWALWRSLSPGRQVHIRKAAAVKL